MALAPDSNFSDALNAQLGSDELIPDQPAADPTPEAPVETTPASPEAQPELPSPELTELDARIAASPILKAKIDAADLLAKAGDKQGVERLFAEVTSELGIVDPQAIAPVVPQRAVTPSAQTALADQEVAWNTINHEIQTKIIEQTQQRDQFSAQRESIIQNYHAKINELVNDPEAPVSAKQAKDIADSIYGERYAAVNGYLNGAIGELDNFSKQQATVKLVEANCRISPQLAAVKVAYANAVHSKQINTAQPIAAQLQQLASLGVNVPRATPTVTRATMDRLKAMKGPQLSQGKTGAGGRAGSAGKANEHGMTTQGANYFRNLGIEVPV